MHSIGLFLEDYAHELIIGALVRKVAAEFRADVNLEAVNSTGGFASVANSLERYYQDMRNSGLKHNLIVVAADCNCQGVQNRKRELEEVATQDLPPIVYAIPNPHIERWLLIDSRAFKKVFEVGCNPPDLKCERGKYKQDLIREMLNAGYSPVIGGMERAVEIINAMVIPQNPRDPSFGDFITDLRSYFRFNPQ